MATSAKVPSHRLGRMRTPRGATTAAPGGGATTAPADGSTNLEEGDFFYDTDDNQLKVYRETSSGVFEFVPIMVGAASGDSDTVDAGAF